MSRVIRGSGQRRVVPASVVDAKTEAEQILEQARSEAAELVRDAKDQAEQIRARAEEEGAARGKEAAAAALLEAAAEREEVLGAADQELAGVVLEAARRVVRRELRMSPADVSSLVESLLEQVRSAKAVVVSVHPDDVARVRSILEARAGSAEGGFSVQEDPTIEPGGCVMTSELGQLDARIETQLAALETAITRSPSSNE